MKRLFKGLLFAAGMVIMTACSGGGSYSPEKCAQLQEKIESKEPLTDADYSEMIDQLGAIVKVGKEKEAEFADNEAKQKEYARSDEGKQMLSYFFVFGMYLDSHGDDLSNSNKRKINKIMEEFKAEKEKK